MQIIVKLTLEEANAAAALWEAAVKALGDPAVDTYVLLRNRLREAAKAAQEASEVPSVQDV